MDNILFLSFFENINFFINDPTIKWTAFGLLVLFIFIFLYSKFSKREDYLVDDYDVDDAPENVRIIEREKEIPVEKIKEKIIKIEDGDKINSLKRELIYNKEKINSLEEELVKARTLKNEISEKKSKLEDELFDYQLKYDKIIIEKDNLKSENESLLNSFNTKEEQREEIKNIYKKYEKVLNEKNIIEKEYSEYKERAKSLIEKNKRLNTELLNIKEDISKVKNDNKILTDNVNNVDSENNNLKSEIAELKNKNNKLENQNKDYLDLMNMSHKKIESLNNKIKELENKKKVNNKEKEVNYYGLNNIKSKISNEQYRKVNQAWLKLSNKVDQMAYLVFDNDDMIHSRMIPESYYNRLMNEVKQRHVDRNGYLVIILYKDKIYTDMISDVIHQ